MKLNYIDFNRLNQYINLYFKGVDPGEKLKIKIDFMLSVLLDGAGMNDYFEFEFYKKRRVERATFVCRKKRALISKRFNDSAYVPMFSDKAQFNLAFSEFVKRDWLDMDTADEDAWNSFLKKHDTFLVKAKTESCGIGIRVCKRNEIKDVKAFYESLRLEHVLVEERLVQEGSVSELHPESLNTLRIVTVRMSNGDVRVMNANLRIGIDQRIMDNFHQEGIAAAVDTATGIVCSTGCDMHLNKHLVHPVTNKTIIGYAIPQWCEAVEMVKAAAQRIPQVSYVGWDVAVQCKGYGVVMIEGNPDSDTDVQQMCDQVGKWPDYEKLM